jgi:hypothetical protein
VRARPSLRHALAALAGVAALAAPVVLGIAAQAAADDTTDPTSPTSEPTQTPTDTPTATPVPTATPTAEPTPDGAFSVDDAVLRWGINDEVGNRAFAPGTHNFLSAGVVPDPGGGGKTIVDRRWRGTDVTAWRARSGAVTIEKVTTGGPQVATWAGLTTGPDGSPITSPTSGIVSNHQVVVSGGSGTVDPDAGTARISWRGSFSVVFYSGMTFFTVTDPTLVVGNGTARLTATARGYASDMNDPSKWQPIAPVTVTLAELAAPDLASARGFTSAARYLKVRYSPPAGGTSQVRTGTHWGAFPASLLGFLEKVGMAPYWYSSGGATDAFKVAAPLTVSWDATTPIGPEVPDETVRPSTTPSTSVAPAPPAPAPSVAPAAPAAPAQPAAPPLPVAAPAAPPAADGPPTSVSGYQPPTVYALTSAAADGGTAADPHDRHWEWWVGSLLLLGAAGSTLLIRVLGPGHDRTKGTS